MTHSRRFKRFGFTLIELLVVVSIIGILAAVIYPNFTESRAIARDAERQANLELVAQALELYKQKYGRYPEACNGRVSGASMNWAGQPGSDYDCPDHDHDDDVGTPDQPNLEYIVGLVPEFLPALPVDLRPNGTDSGYVYAVNVDGSVYKFMAHRTVESEVLTNDPPTGTMNHPYFLCGSNYDDNAPAPGGMPSYEDNMMCRQYRSAWNTVQGNAPDCRASNSDSYERTYAISGGFAFEEVLEATFANNEERVKQHTEFFTERIRCSGA